MLLLNIKDPGHVLTTSLLLSSDILPHHKSWLAFCAYILAASKSSPLLPLGVAQGVSHGVGGGEVDEVYGALGIPVGQLRDSQWHAADQWSSGCS